MNQISKIRSRLIDKKIAVSDNSSESFIDALQDEINHLQDDNLKNATSKKASSYSRPVTAKSTHDANLIISQHVDRHKELLSKSSKLYATEINKQISLVNPNGYESISSRNGSSPVKRISVIS